ncbi:MAG: hypothetical protein KAU27_04625 [Desulfuromonadales bacterium]|nr:hypothetical protein [Desulfuromonadales bacterium]
MKQLVTLIFTVLLTGCLAPTAEQSLQMNLDTQAVDHAYALCKSTVDSTPEAMRLGEYFVLGKNKEDHYLAKITDENYATDEQISDIYNYQDNLRVCRDKAVEDLQVFNVDYALLVSDYLSKDDEITADVISKKITIGEANRKVTESEYQFSLKEYDLKNTTNQAE